MNAIVKNRSLFRPMVFTRHPTHSILRANHKNLGLLAFRSVVRLGSTTDTLDTVTNGGERIECNTIQAIKNSSNKLLMKQCFTENNVKTANWYTIERGYVGPEAAEIKELEPWVYAQQWNNDGYKGDKIHLNNLLYPIVAKHIFGSRGRGNTLINSEEELTNWIKNKTLSQYIFEKFYNYNREYRLHVTEEGCFYTCRKMLRKDTPEDKRWFRNDSNSNWIVEENPDFDKPVNWDNVITESVNALKAVGLDFGAVDLRIQSSKDNKGKTRENPDFIVVEINSAPSFGEITTKKYIEEIPKILKRKQYEKKK